MYGCKQDQRPVPSELPDLSFRESYEQSLATDKTLSYDDSRQWMEQSLLALKDSTMVTLPYQEQSPALQRYSAYGLNVNGIKGEQLEISIESQEPILVDVWYKGPIWQLLNYDHQYDRELQIPFDHTGTFLIRVQTLLGNQAPFKIKMIKSPQNMMPVVGAKDEDVWSRFGDPRDAGKRVHEGVDIFKRRGTPVVAAASGRVIDVKDEGLGGKQVWIQDHRLPINHYYAHLDQQLVEEEVYVNKGDTIGTVGNTGNAQSTRPHLHYGMYQHGAGAIDPFPFVGSQPYVSRFRTYMDTLPETWAGPKRIPIRISPSPKAPIIHQGDYEGAMSVLGWTNHWWHLRLADGRSGFIHAPAINYTQRK